MAIKILRIKYLLVFQILLQLDGFTVCYTPDIIPIIEQKLENFNNVI